MSSKIIINETTIEGNVSGGIMNRNGLATQTRPIVIGTLFSKQSERVKVVGLKGKTTVMVVVDPHPISSRPEPARGIRIGTLLRDWTRVET